MGIVRQRQCLRTLLSCLPWVDEPCQQFMLHPHLHRGHQFPCSLQAATLPVDTQLPLVATALILYKSFFHTDPPQSLRISLVTFLDTLPLRFSFNNVRRHTSPSDMSILCSTLHHRHQCMITRSMQIKCTISLWERETTIDQALSLTTLTLRINGRPFVNQTSTLDRLATNFLMSLEHWHHFPASKLKA